MFNVDSGKYIGIKAGDGDVVYMTSERMVYGRLFIIKELQVIVVGSTVLVTEMLYT
jgi:hypothetical protein